MPQWTESGRTNSLESVAMVLDSKAPLCRTLRASRVAVLLFACACSSASAPDKPSASAELPLIGPFSFTFTRVDDPSLWPATHDIRGLPGEVRVAGPFGSPTLGGTVSGLAGMTLTDAPSETRGRVEVQLIVSGGSGLQLAEPYRYQGRVRTTAAGLYRVQIWLRPFVAQPAFLARDTVVDVPAR